MKGQMWFGVAVMFIIIVLALSVGWVNPGAILGGAKYILEPQYGTYWCERGDQVYNTEVPFVHHEGGFLGIGAWDDIYLRTPGNSDKARFGVKFICKALICDFGRIKYNYINVYGTWDADRFYSFPRLSFGESHIYMFDKDFLSGEQVYVTIESTGLYEIRGVEDYFKYQLVQRSANGYTDIANPDGCQRPTLIKPVGNDQIPPELCVSGCDRNVVGDRVDFNQYWNYLGGYSLVPSEFAFTDPVDNKPVYCQPVGSYAILKNFKQITTESGNYMVVDSFKRNVECCPGQTLGTSTCNSNFEWETSVTCTYKCDIFNTVSSCPGAGSWVIDYSDPARQTLQRATGCSLNGCCEMDKITVECTENSQCPPNKPVCINNVCQVSGSDPFVPTCGNRVCEQGESDPNSEHYCPADCEGIPTCGNGVCEQGETPANCPFDCGQPSNYNWIWVFVFTALGLLIGYLLGDVIGAGIGGIIGGIIGYGVYVFVSMAWWQQFLLLLGGGITGALIGYGLFMILPIVVALIIALSK